MEYYPESVMPSEGEARSEGHLKKARSKMNGPFLLNCIKFQKQNMSRQFIFFITLVLLGQAILAQKNGLSFLALGDSYTASTGELHSNGWPAQLVKTLADKGIKIKNPTIIAGAGWTTSELIEQIQKKEPVAENDLVGLLIGVNNQYRSIDISVFKKEFAQLLETCISLANNDEAKVFVLSIPDWGATPYAKRKNREKISAELNAYNDFIESETKKRNILYFDITGISRKARFNKSLIAADSLHPSRKMYRLWVNKMKKPLLTKLQ